MTAIPGGNNNGNGNPGGGVGADLGGNYLQRDGGGVAADRTGSGTGAGAGAGAGAHGGRRDNHGTEPDTVRPPQSIDNSMRGGGGDGGEAGTWTATDPESFLRENLSLKDLVSLAYMFNFVEAGVLGFGERKAVVQVREAGQGHCSESSVYERTRMLMSCDTTKKTKK